MSRKCPTTPARLSDDPEVSYFTGPILDVPPGLTETQTELFLLLSTGIAYSGNVLRRSVRHDRLTTMNVVRVHLHNLKKKIRPYGLEIVCERRPGKHGSRANDYRMVRLLCPMQTSIQQIDWFAESNVRNDNPPKKRIRKVSV